MRRGERGLHGERVQLIDALLRVRPADEAAAKGKQMMSAGFGMAKGMMGK